MTTSVSADLREYIAANDRRFHEELFELLRIPSVSARAEHDGDTRRTAEWLREALESIGLDASVHETPGHPIVLGEWRRAPEHSPTVLVYGHYDVQPPEPLELWDSPPFEPTIRDGRIYARGSADDKGQVIIHLKALEAHLKTRGSLPVNVIVLLEGEEETGSDHLAEFVETNRERLRCDGVVISDSSMMEPGLPTIISSLRGIAYLEIEVVGPAQDLHSGSFGGAVVNPAMALARILATFQDENGRIAIPGIYDAVREPSASMRAALLGVPFDEAAFREEAGVSEVGGEAGYSTAERLWLRTSCDVNGMISGYTGEGAKTVLPSRAMAKVSFRIVPDQTPDEIGRLVEEHVKRVAPRGVSVTVRHLHGGRPWRAEAEGPLFDAARRALEAAFGRAPVIIGEGASIPIVVDIERILGVPVLLTGFGLPGQNLHAPNEWLGDENFRQGIVAVAAFWDEYGRREQVGA